MTNKTKIIIGIAAIAAIYVIYTSTKKKRKNPTQTRKINEEDVLGQSRSAYNIIPLPDIKGTYYRSITPIYPVGNMNSSPILVAFPKP